MKKFLVLYYAPEELMKSVGEKSPEEMKKGMEPWMAWAKRCGSGLVDLGAPLGDGEKVTKSGSTPIDSEAVGYSILQAEDMESAKKMLDEHPHLEWDATCSIELHEILPLPK